jgi:peptidoglycan/LPS O-acetylase OafA/YrhL
MAEPVSEPGLGVRASSINLEGRFAFIDGLRAVAAVAVMLFHFFNHWVSPIHGALAAILPRGTQFILEHGDLGVEVFFVLSGFVIAHSLFGKAVTPKYAGTFVLRRSLRLDPPYWTVIAISLALPYLMFPKMSQNLFTTFGGTAGVAVNMFYLPDLLWQPRIVGVAWTLCIEVQFYLAFLFLLLVLHGLRAMMRDRNHWIPAAVAGTIFTLLLSYSVYRWFSMGRNDFGGRWFMFFTGVLSYWTLAGRIDRRIFLGYIGAIIGLAILFREPRAGMVLLTTLIICASAPMGGLQSWLSGWVFQYFGRISYSLYLVHMTVGIAAIRLVMRFTHGSNASVFIALAAAIVVSVLLADLLNRFVEIPAMRLSKCFRSPTAGRAGQIDDAAKSR